MLALERLLRVLLDALLGDLERDRARVLLLVVRRGVDEAAAQRVEPLARDMAPDVDAVADEEVVDDADVGAVVHVRVRVREDAERDVLEEGLGRRVELGHGRRLHVGLVAGHHDPLDLEVDARARHRVLEAPLRGVERRARELVVLDEKRYLALERADEP